MDKKFIIGIVLFTLLIIGGAIFYGNNSSSKAAVEKTSGAKIQTFEEDFDFKEIKYDGGNAKHPFKIKNVGTKDLTIANMVTSCMCTEATLMHGDKKMGPFGMPGHSGIPKVNDAVNPGEEVGIEAVFDPAAHGPAGVGLADRVVFVEDGAGRQLQLRFTVMVTP